MAAALEGKQFDVMFETVQVWPGTDASYTQMYENFVPWAKRLGVKQFISIGGGCGENPREDCPLSPPLYELSQDMNRSEHILRDSGVPYTIIRVGVLIPSNPFHPDADKRSGNSYMTTDLTKFGGVLRVDLNEQIVACIGAERCLNKTFIIDDPTIKPQFDHWICKAGKRRSRRLRKRSGLRPDAARHRSTVERQSMTLLTRRTALATAGAAATSFLVPARTDAASPLPQLEFPTPASYVRAFIKILASLEDDTIFHMYKGTMEAVVPGRAPVRLVDSTTVIRRQVEVLPEGHRISIWEATVYHGQGETEPLESFVNPLNGRTVRPFHQREGAWADPVDGPGTAVPARRRFPVFPIRPRQSVCNGLDAGR